MTAAAALATAPSIDGLSNFRDAGRSVAGLADGRLYRSANLAGLTDGGLAQLSALGISRVVDLRGIAERLTALPAVGDGVIEIVSTPVEPRTSAKLRDLLASGEATADRLRDLMIDSYQAYVTEAAEIFGEALVAIAGTGASAALVHCTAGKDRTGFIVALVQTAAGASRSAVLADYLETNRAWDRASVSGHLPLDSPVVQPILVADADYLAAAFETIDREDGSVDAFIHRATRGRLTADQLAAHIRLETQS